MATPTAIILVDRDGVVVDVISDIPLEYVMLEESRSDDEHDCTPLVQNGTAYGYYTGDMATVDAELANDIYQEIKTFNEGD